MIELAFDESTAGALKLAKSMKRGERMAGADAVFGDAGDIWSGMTMEGSSKDVEALTLRLDIGDISDMDTGMNACKKTLDDLFADFPGVSDEIWKTDQHALMRIREAESTQEHIRMWVCTSDPAEVCSLCFICHLMLDSQVPLTVVFIPEQIEKDNCIINYKSTREVVPEALGAFAEYGKPISKLQRKYYANMWSELVRENAPLRAIVNGSLIGVPEYFYDFALRANMPAGEFRVAQLIGRTLGCIPGVGDRWLFLRIQGMIKSGELIEISAATDDHPYSGIVKRNSSKRP